MKIREHWLAKQQHLFSRNNPSVKVFPYKTYYISVCVCGSTRSISRLKFDFDKTTTVILTLLGHSD